MSLPVLNRALVLEAATRTPDGAGGAIETWAPLGTLWAEVVPRTGREASGAALTLSRTAYRITLRAAPQGAPSRPAAGQRLRDGARLFHLRAVTETPDGRHLICFADEEIVT